MAKRLCPIHGVWEKKDKRSRCPKCSRQTNKVYDRFNRDKKSAKFYSSPQWRELRIVILKREPICRMCKVSTAQMVDHIIPISKGGCMLCYDNLQPLCNSCHGYKTNKEGNLHRPYWMPIPLIPVTMVCGSPGSGKTTYCEEKMGKDDLLIDLDYIRADILGVNIYQWEGKEKLDEALLKRNSILSSLAKPGVEDEYNRVWLVLSAPKRETREWWADRLKADIIVMDTPIAVCKERIAADTRRAGREEYFMKLIVLWWSEYII